MSSSWNGARTLISTAHALGVRVCFANPGTTELGLVRALDDEPGIRPVLGLFEGVCTGAADGYARFSGLPALTLLHLGPGLGNGIANLHNARRAGSPVVNIVGDHATWHLPFDAPLTSDIATLARPVSAAVITVGAPDAIVENVREAIRRSLQPADGGVVTVIAPSDVMDAALPAPAAARGIGVLERTDVPTERIDDVATRLLASEHAVVLLGTDSLTEHGQYAARDIADMTGARVLMETYPAVVALGGDLPRLERLAYFPDDVLKQLDGATVVLAGARTPVSYFGYEGQPSMLVPEDRTVLLSAPAEDGVAALEKLRDRLRDRRPTKRPQRPEPTPSASVTANSSVSDELSPSIIADMLVRCLPQDAIVSIEGATCGGPYLQRAHRAARHSVMTNTGGAIGQGIPCAIGAAIARPNSRVVCLQSDGSAQYTLQALWTLAHENLPVTVIIAANHRYGILQNELKRAGADLERPATRRLTELGAPRIDWVSIAHGYGVPACRTATAGEFEPALVQALAMPGPFLIEAQL